MGESEHGVNFLRRLGDAVRNRFCSISVREKGVGEFLFSKFGVLTTLVCDPTFLIPNCDYPRFDSNSYVPKEKYLFTYALGLSPFVMRISRSIARRLGVKLVAAQVSLDSWLERPRGKDIVRGIAPDRFLEYIRNAEYVIAESFHGTAFSIIFQKKFLTVCGGEIDQNSRKAFLLSRFDLSDRIASPIKTDDELVAALCRPLPKELVVCQTKMAQDSLAWLRDNLTKEVKGVKNDNVC